METHIDWDFTEDGDLRLGGPKTNSEGLKLFRHKDGTIDTHRGEDGKEIRDIGYSIGLETEAQVIMNRLKTDAPDWFHHPNMGGNLSDLVGEPNRKETGILGVNLIYSALTYREMYRPEEINVRPIPINQHEILFMIKITKNDNQPYQIPLVFNLEHGVLSMYEV